MTKTVLMVLFATTILLTSLTLTSIDFADAIKAKGSHGTQLAKGYGSTTKNLVCGDRLCSEPTITFSVTPFNLSISPVNAAWARVGTVISKDSVLARAAFEITVPTLAHAALTGDIERLKGVTENVIVGANIPVGSGTVDLYMKVAKKS